MYVCNMYGYLRIYVYVAGCVYVRNLYTFLFRNPIRGAAPFRLSGKRIRVSWEKEIGDRERLGKRRNEEEAKWKDEEKKRSMGK